MMIQSETEKFEKISKDIADLIRKTVEEQGAGFTTIASIMTCLTTQLALLQAVSFMNEDPSRWPGIIAKFADLIRDSVSENCLIQFQVVSAMRGKNDNQKQA